MKVEVKRDICIGAAPCIAVAPNVYELDDEGKAIVKADATEDLNGAIHTIKTESADDSTLLLAAQSCPVQAIFVYDDDGKQVFPANDNSNAAAA